MLLSFWCQYLGIRKVKTEEEELLGPDVHGVFPPVCQDAGPVVIGEAGTCEVAEADGEEERRAGRSEEPKRETAGGDDGGRKDHRRAQRAGRCFCNHAELLSCCSDINQPTACNARSENKYGHF